MAEQRRSILGLEGYQHPASSSGPAPEANEDTRLHEDRLPLGHDSSMMAAGPQRIDPGLLGMKNSHMFQGPTVDAAATEGYRDPDLPIRAIRPNGFSHMQFQFTSQRLCLVGSRHIHRFEAAGHLACPKEHGISE